MPRSPNVPTSPKVINKHADKNKNSNTIQAARLIKNSTNNPMLNSIDPTSLLVDNTDAGWTQKTSKRNHSDSSEPKSPDPTSNKKNNNKLFITTNRYEVLTQTEPAATIIEADTVSEGSIITDHIKPPPPIFMKGVLDFPGFSSVLIELIGVDNFYCKSSTDRLKIQTANPESYRTLIRYLKDQKAEYHTFQLKEDKPLRVVIRNLHPSTPTELIKAELETRLYEVRQVTNVLHKINKRPLPLFFIDLEPTDHSNEIYHLSSLLHTKVKIEEPYKPKMVSQCLNCQDYGHTRSYCGYSARCVRCGDSHSSSDCTKPRDSPPRCALCAGNHPANYRGCNVYRELQRRNKPNNKSKFLHDNVNFKSTNNNSTVKESHPPVETNPITLPPSSSQRTYAQATSNQTRDTNHSPPELDFDKKISSFLDEFKSVINPLITLLTQVISSLLNNKNDK